MASESSSSLKFYSADQLLADLQKDREQLQQLASSLLQTSTTTTTTNNNGVEKVKKNTSIIESEDDEDGPSFLREMMRPDSPRLRITTTTTTTTSQLLEPSSHSRDSLASGVMDASIRTDPDEDDMVIHGTPRTVATSSASQQEGGVGRINKSKKRVPPFHQQSSSSSSAEVAAMSSASMQMDYSQSQGYSMESSERSTGLGGTTTKPANSIFDLVKASNQIINNHNAHHVEGQTPSSKATRPNESSSNNNSPEHEDLEEDDMDSFWEEGCQVSANVWEDKPARPRGRRPKLSSSSASKEPVVSLSPSLTFKSKKNTGNDSTQQSTPNNDGIASSHEQHLTNAAVAKPTMRGKRLFNLDVGETKKQKKNKKKEPSNLVELEEEEEEMDPFDIRPRFTDDHVAAGRDDTYEPLVLESTFTYMVHSRANQYLRQYQRDGIRFMFNNITKGLNALLNDDMGLGKTVQVVSLLLALLKKRGDLADKRRVRERRKARNESDIQSLIRTDERSGTILIIAPKSVLTQWGRELDTWGYFDWEDLSFAKDDEAKQDLLKRCMPMRRGSISCNIEVLLMPYSVLSKDSGPVLRTLLEIPFRLVVFDEVHTLKNLKSNQTTNARSLRAGSRIGLTGTMMQNDLREFYTVLTTVNPKVLGPWKVFNEHYAMPIKLARVRTASEEALKIGQDRARGIRAILDRYVLRRTKKLIQEQMPKKRENVVFCKMTPLQQRVYERIANGPDATLLKYAKEKCDCGRKHMKRSECCYRTDETAPLWVQYHPAQQDCKKCPYCLQLPMISKLISCCNHLDLLKADPSNESVQEVEYKHAFAKLAFGNDLDQIGGLDRAKHFELVSSPDLSGKLFVLGQLLSVWRLQPNSRVLVFSHYTRLLDIIGKYLDRQGMRHCRIDGSTSSAVRQQTVDEFNDLDNNNNFVFLISTKAGGLGLNLTAANIVVLFDSSWNPAFDVQAQDRAYRLGQRRDVDVYRLISTGTIEDKTYCRQLYKMQLSSEALEGNREERFFEGVQGDAMRQGELFGVQNLVDYNPEGHLAELRRLYRWKNPVATPKPASSSSSSSPVAAAEARGGGGSVSAATRAAIQASAAAGNFAVEQVGLVEESPLEEDPGEDVPLTGTKDEDMEMAQLFLAAYGVPIEESKTDEDELGVEASATQGENGSKKKRVRKGVGVSSSESGLVENLDKIVHSTIGGRRPNDNVDDEIDLITEDEEEDVVVDDIDDVESGEFSDNDDEDDIEDEIRAKVSSIINAHSHMAVDGKDLVRADKASKE